MALGKLFRGEPFLGQLKVAVIVDGGGVLIIHNEIIPFGWWIAGGGMNGLEFGVVYTMKLWGYGTSPKVTNEANSACVNG